MKYFPVGTFSLYSVALTSMQTSWRLYNAALTSKVLSLTFLFKCMLHLYQTHKVVRMSINILRDSIPGIMVHD